MRSRINIFILLVVALLGGCKQNQDAYKVITEPTLKRGNSVPLPSGKVILSGTGKIQVTNGDGRLDFDLAMLERLGMVEYNVEDPEYKRVVRLSGPLLQSILDIAQLQPDAKELRASALNRYKTTIPLDVTRWPVIVATYRDGQRLPFEEKGPIQIAFPNQAFDIDPAMYNPMWVWHLHEIEVR